MRAASAVPAVLALATLALLAAGATETTPADDFGLGGLGGLAFLLAALAFALVGALIASRVRGNPIGPIFLVNGLMLGVGDLAYQYADWGLFVSQEQRPAAEVAAWLQNVAVTPLFGLFALALLLFPNGRLPSRRWAIAAAVALAGSALVLVGYAFRPGALDEPFESVSNPLGIGGARAALDGLTGLGWLLMAVGLACAALATVARLRRTSGVERQQLRWIALAAAVAGVVVVLDVCSFLLSVEGVAQLRIAALGLAFAGFPLAAGAAILRYRLYDLDVVVNRALVYGALTLTLAASYAACVLMLQVALSPGSDLAVAASTLAVAGLFRPLRRRIQALVDRRFFRRRYDAARTLERFGVHVRDEVELGAVAGELRAVVGDTMQPAHVSLWLRERAS